MNQFTILFTISPIFPGIPVKKSISCWNFSDTQSLTAKAASLILSQFAIIKTTPAAIPIIINPVGLNKTDPILPRTTPKFATILLAPVTSADKTPPFPTIFVIPSDIPGANVSVKNGIIFDKLVCTPVTQSIAEEAMSTRLNTPFTAVRPATNPIITLPADVSNSPASIPLKASHKIVPTCPMIVSQSILERNCPMPLPNPSQSVSCATLAKVPNNSVTNKLSVAPAVAQSMPFIILFNPV